MPPSSSSRWTFPRAPNCGRPSSTTSPSRRSKTPRPTPRRVLIPLVKTAAGDLDYAAVLVYGGKMPALGRLSSVNFPLLHTKNINVERSVVQLRLPESYRWFNFGGTAEMAEEADVAANKLSYQANQVERLTEVILQADPPCPSPRQESPRRGLAQLPEHAEQVLRTPAASRRKRRNCGGTGEERQACSSRRERPWAWRKQRPTGRGPGTLNLRSLESAEGGQSKRARNVVQRPGTQLDGEAQAPQPAAQQSTTIRPAGNSIPSWFKGKDSTRTTAQGGLGGFGGGRAASAAARAVNEPRRQAPAGPGGRRRRRDSSMSKRKSAATGGSPAMASPCQHRAGAPVRPSRPAQGERNAAQHRGRGDPSPIARRRRSVELRRRRRRRPAASGAVGANCRAGRRVRAGRTGRPGQPRFPTARARPGLLLPHAARGGRDYGPGRLRTTSWPNWSTWPWPWRPSS